MGKEVVIKKEEEEGNPAFCNNIDLEGIMISEISQSKVNPV